LTTDLEKGGLSISSYQLEYDQGTGQSVGGGSWTTLVGYPSDYASAEYTLSGSITGG
jgi:hypothetical protein